MTDTYQAIYDATRSRLSNGNIGEAILTAAREALAFDIYGTLREAVIYIQHQNTRPSVLFTPKIYPDGDSWCALLGEDLASGVVGFGSSPSEAMEMFDRAFYEKRVLPTKTCTEKGGV